MEFDIDKYSYYSVFVDEFSGRADLYASDGETMCYTIGVVVEIISSEFVIIEYANVLIKPYTSINYDNYEKRYAWAIQLKNGKWVIAHIAFDLYPDLLEYYRQHSEVKYKTLLAKILGKNENENTNKS